MLILRLDSAGARRRDLLTPRIDLQSFWKLFIKISICVDAYIDNISFAEWAVIYTSLLLLSLELTDIKLANKQLVKELSELSLLKLDMNSVRRRRAGWTPNEPSPTEMEFHSERVAPEYE